MKLVCRLSITLVLSLSCTCPAYVQLVQLKRLFIFLHFTTLPGNSSKETMAVKRSRWLLIITACLFNMITTTQTTDKFEQQCLSFSAKRAPNAHIQVLEYIPRGTNLTLADNDSTCSRQSQQISADICRVALSVTTSNRSSIVMELWLPREWSGRFLGTGNGGIDGCKRCAAAHSGK